MPTSAGLRTPSPDARAPAAAEAKSLMGESGAVGQKGRKRGAEWRRGETCQGAPHRRLAYSASNHRPIAATSLHLPAVLLSPPCPSLSPLSFSLPPVLLSPPCPSLSPLSFSLPAVLLSPPYPSLSPLSFSLPPILLSPHCPPLSPLSFSLPPVLLSPHCPPLIPSFALASFPRRPCAFPSPPCSRRLRLPPPRLFIPSPYASRMSAHETEPVLVHPPHACPPHHHGPHALPAASQLHPTFVRAALHFEAPSIPTFSVLHLSSPVPLLPCPHNGPIVHLSMAHMLALLHVPFPPSSPSAAKGNAEEGEVEGEGVRK
ncbi:unnamed protein product [Closterium sp. NIES-64]|nr:unnamed protein product [Closterium sp. NIES-64]